MHRPNSSATPPLLFYRLILLLTLFASVSSTAAAAAAAAAAAHSQHQRRQDDSPTPVADPFAVPADGPSSALETSRLLQSSVQALLSSAGATTGSIPAAQETATRYNDPQPAPRPIAPLACAIFQTITGLCASGSAPSPSATASASASASAVPFLSLDLPAQASCACYSAAFFVPEPFDAAASACANVHGGGCQGPACAEAPYALGAMGLCAGQGNVRDAPQAVLGEMSAAASAGAGAGAGEGTTDATAVGTATATGGGSDGTEEAGSTSATNGGGLGAEESGGGGGEEGAAPRVEGTTILGLLWASAATAVVFARFLN